MSRPTLRLGSRGSDVAHLQELLNRHLTPSPRLVVDGRFGPQTDGAVRRFQAAHNLTVDGIVGPRTWARLASLGSGTPPSGTSPSPPPAGGGGSQTIPPEAYNNPNWPPRPSFRPLANNDERARVFGRFSYVAAPTPDNPEAIRITDDWPARNIVTVELPQLARATNGQHRSMRFHRLAANQLRRLWEAWEQAGLLDRVLTFAGAWVPRFVRDSRTVLSNHAFGSAFDINVAWNGLRRQPALVGQRGSVRELVPIAHQHGFYWGGHFTRLDGMHFEVAVVQP